MARASLPDRAQPKSELPPSIRMSERPTMSTRSPAGVYSVAHSWKTAADGSITYTPQIVRLESNDGLLRPVDANSQWVTSVLSGDVRYRRPHEFANIYDTTVDNIEAAHLRLGDITMQRLAIKEALETASYEQARRREHADSSRQLAAQHGETLHAPSSDEITAQLEDLIKELTDISGDLEMLGKLTARTHLTRLDHAIAVNKTHTSSTLYGLPLNFVEAVHANDPALLGGDVDPGEWHTMAASLSYHERQCMARDLHFKARAVETAEIARQVDDAGDASFYGYEYDDQGERLVWEQLLGRAFSNYEIAVDQLTGLRKHQGLSGPIDVSDIKRWVQEHNSHNKIETTLVNIVPFAECGGAVPPEREVPRMLHDGTVFGKTPSTAAYTYMRGPGQDDLRMTWYGYNGQDSYHRFAQRDALELGWLSDMPPDASEAEPIGAIKRDFSLSFKPTHIELRASLAAQHAAALRETRDSLNADFQAWSRAYQLEFVKSFDSRTLATAPLADAIKHAKTSLKELDAHIEGLSGMLRRRELPALISSFDEQADRLKGDFDVAYGLDAVTDDDRIALQGYIDRERKRNLAAMSSLATALHTLASSRAARTHYGALAAKFQDMHSGLAAADTASDADSDARTWISKLYEQHGKLNPWPTDVLKDTAFMQSLQAGVRSDTSSKGSKHPRREKKHQARLSTASVQSARAPELAAQENAWKSRMEDISSVMSMSTQDIDETYSNVWETVAPRRRGREKNPASAPPATSSVPRSKTLRQLAAAMERVLRASSNADVASSRAGKGKQAASGFQASRAQTSTDAPRPAPLKQTFADVVRAWQDETSHETAARAVGHPNRHTAEQDDEDWGAPHHESDLSRFHLTAHLGEGDQIGSILGAIGLSAASGHLLRNLGHEVAVPAMSAETDAEVLARLDDMGIIDDTCESSPNCP